MVEVTLTQLVAQDTTTKPKACWFPFQKQIKGRRALPPTTYGPASDGGETWNDYGSSNPSPSESLGTSGSRRRLFFSNGGGSSSSLDKTFDGHQALHRKNGSKKAGSVSTGAETDTTFFSDESLTAATPASSQATRTETPARSSRSYSGCDRDTTTNSSNGTEESRPRRRRPLPRVVDSNPNPATAHSFDQGYYSDETTITNDPNGSRPRRFRERLSQIETNRGDGLSRVESPPGVEGTSRAGNDFWKAENEAVGGGGPFACLEAREKQPETTRDNATPDKNPLDGTAPTQTTGGGLLAETKNVPKPNEPSNNLDPLGRMMRFVSQDPEDAGNGKSSLRNILCSSVPKYNTFNTPVLCRTRGRGAIDDEDAPNFYVEVQAMRDQLNNVRDLEEIERAENMEHNKDVADSLERKRRQTPRFTNRRASSVPRTARFGTKAGAMARQREKQRNKQSNNVAQTNPGNSSFGGRKSRAKSHHSDPRSTNRQDQLLSEMVSDRVLAMTTDHRIAGYNQKMKSKKDGSETVNILERDSSESANRGHPRRAESNGRRQTTAPPPMQPSSSSPLDVSELTDVSYDKLKKKTSRRGNAPAGSAMQTPVTGGRDDDRRDSEIGSQRRPDSSKPQNNTTTTINASSSSARKNRGSDGGKFDDNFWREDSESINTAAFERYENDSVFDDLKSQSSTPEMGPPKSSTMRESSKPPESARYKRNFGSSNGGIGQHGLGGGKSKDYYSSKRTQAKLRSGNSTARTTYLQ